MSANHAGQAEHIVLSECDTVRVLTLLENPPKPTSALMAAAKRRCQRNRRNLKTQKVKRQFEGV